MKWLKKKRPSLPATLKHTTQYCELKSPCCPLDSIHLLILQREVCTLQSASHSVPPPHPIVFPTNHSSTLCFQELGFFIVHIQDGENRRESWVLTLIIWNVTTFSRDQKNPRYCWPLQSTNVSRVWALYLLKCKCLGSRLPGTLEFKLEIEELTS